MKSLTERARSTKIPKKGKPPRTKVSLCVVLATTFLIGCGLTDPIERAVKKESSKPTPQGMAYYSIHSPITASPTEVVLKVLSQPFWKELPTNIVVLEIRQVSITHTDTQQLSPEHWTAVLANTKFGKKIVFLQREQFHRDSQAAWTYYVIDGNQ